MAPIIGGQGEADITPSSFEVSDPMIKWQRELDSIRARHDRLEISNRQELLAHKDQIAQEVTHRLNESMSAINNEIMEYLLKTQRQIQSWAEDTKSARWEALELRYKEREEERRKHKDQQILDHFKLYESIMQRNADAPQQPSTSKPRPEVAYRGPEPPVPMPPAQAGVRVLPSQGHLFTPSEPQRQLQPLAYHPMVPPQPLPSHGVPIHPAAPVHQDIPFQNESEATIHRNQNKRKADDVTPIREHEVIAKRPRTRDGANSAGASSTPFRAGQPRPESQSQGTTSGGDQRRISFAEVYQDGNAEYKHIIVEYPTKSNKWYILRCDEHVVHFGKNPLLGAAKHLHSVQHNNAAKLHSLAVDQLGHLVHDCTAELADKNNAAVNKAFQDGYVPLNVNRLNKAERATQNQTSPDSTPPFMSASLPRKSADVAKLSFSQPGPSRPHPIAANPRPGELYLGYWAQTKTRFPVMVLPLQGDLSATGLPGTLASIGLMEAAPRCINVDRPTQQVIGWAPGYENGGPLSCKREYPVMYFDGKKHVGWLQAKYISPFNFEAPDASAIPEFDVARDYYARAKGFPDYEHMKRHSGVPPTAPTQVATSPREPLVHTPTSSHFPGLTRSPRAGEPRPAENGSDMRRQWHTKGLPGTGSFRIPDRNSPSLVASHQGFTPSNSPPLKTVNAALSGTSESLVLPPILTTAPHPQGHGSGIHKLLASDVSPVNQASPHSFINSNPASFSDKTGSTPPQQKATPVSRSSPKPSTDDTAPAAAADLMGIANRAISASASTAGSTEGASETQSNETGEQAKTLREKAKLSMEKLSTAFPAAEASVAASDSSVSSLTPVPTSASDPPSRKSTPAISPLENSDKWEGRASEGAAATSSRPKSSSSTAQGAASPPAHSPMPTPVSLNDEAMGSKERRFVVAEYSADEQQMADGKEASPLTLVVGGESQVAESHNKDLKVQIDPRKIATITMSQDETIGLGKAVLQLRSVDGSASQQLTFESTASDASPVESGRLQARQFIRWIKSVNSKVTFNDDSASNGVKKESTSG